MGHNVAFGSRHRHATGRSIEAASSAGSRDHRHDRRGRRWCSICSTGRSPPCSRRPGSSFANCRSRPRRTSSASCDARSTARSSTRWRRSTTPSCRAGRIDLVAHHFSRGPRSLSARRTLHSPGGWRRGSATSGRACCSTGESGGFTPEPAMGREVVATWPGSMPAVAADLHRRRECRRRPPPGLPPAVLGRRAAPGVLRRARLRHRSGQHARAACSTGRPGNGLERDAVAARAAPSPLQLGSRTSTGAVVYGDVAARGRGGADHAPDAVLSARRHPLAPGRRRRRRGRGPSRWALPAWPTSAPGRASATGRRCCR